MKDQPNILVEGGLYAHRTGQFCWEMFKILKIENNVIHIRTYGNRFWRRPSVAALSKLDWSVGHMPFERSAVEKWRLEYITTQAVSYDELEGYRIWASEDGAGVWS